MICAVISPFRYCRTGVTSVTTPGSSRAWVSTTASFSMLMFRSRSTGTKGFILPVKELKEGKRQGSLGVEGP